MVQVGKPRRLDVVHVAAFKRDRQIGRHRVQQLAAEGLRLPLEVVTLRDERRKTARVLGDLLHGFIVDQFRRCRDGDWFWYQRPGALTDWERFEVERTTLATIINRNTGLALAGDVFHVPDRPFPYD